MLKANCIIAQSGGPTSVINASLAGIITAAKDFKGIKKVFGMRFGIEGLLGGDIIDLGRLSSKTIKALNSTPSSILGSSRYKLADADLPKILTALKENDIRYIFFIGGNDTMDTINRIELYTRRQDYELAGIGVPKTVDNDLFGTDHTPGFPSAARYVALSVMQAGILARDMQKVDKFVIFQAIGRKAGWLTAAAAAGKKSPEDAPHILCLPERPFEKARFLKAVKSCHDRYGFVSIVCGEGIAYADGSTVSASAAKDRFGNIEFGAMGGASAAAVLHRMITEEFGWRGEFQIPESLIMCAADRAAGLDIEEANMAGRAAVELAKQGKSGLMVTLERGRGKRYRCTTGSIALREAAVKTRPMPEEFISKDGSFITDAFLDYIRPLVGELPQYAGLDT